MGTPHEPDKVKLICGVLAGGPGDLAEAVECLREAVGQVDRTSAVWPFSDTAYYADEIGTTIFRQFVSFAEPFAMERLAAVKLATNALEASLAADRSVAPRRPINLDPGYVTLGALVLATTKGRPHRIYLGQGIYAEVTLNFESGAWRGWPWTYTDFVAPTYHSFLSAIRDDLKRDRRSGSS